MRKSLSSIWISTSSASGSTATVAALVWMRPCCSVAGTRWTRWTPLSNFNRANTLSPVTLAMISLKPPISPADADIEFDPPAARRGIAFVHAVQVAGEQRGFVAAGAGADFEHRRLGIGLVLRQQFQRQGALGAGQTIGDGGQFLLRHGVHFVIGGNGFEIARFVAQRAHRCRCLHHRSQFGIVLGQLDELVRRQRRIAHLRREIGMAPLDLRDALG